MKAVDTQIHAVTGPPSLLNRFASKFGPIGAYAYLAGFVLPLSWDIPLVILGLMSALAIAFSPRTNQGSWSLLTVAVLGFVVATGLSMLVSEDIGRSLLLSAPLLPGLLLFFLIAEHFNGMRDTRLLYITFSVVGIGLSVVLLWAAWQRMRPLGLRGLNQSTRELYTHAAAWHMCSAASASMAVVASGSE
jgi:hypothetical protein